MKSDGISTLVQELTHSTDEECSHAVKYVLQACVNVGMLIKDVTLTKPQWIISQFGFSIFGTTDDKYLNNYSYTFLEHCRLGTDA